MWGGSLQDYFFLTGDGDTAHGGSAEGSLANQIDYGTAPAGVRVDLRAGTGRRLGARVVDRLYRIKEVDGSKYGDVLLGGRWKDWIEGAGGDDILRGRGKADNLYGQTGDDDLNGGPGDDDLTGGPGADHCRNGESLRGCEKRS